MKTQLLFSAEVRTAFAVSHRPNHSSGLPVALAAFAILTLVAPSARATVTEAWVHRYNNVVNNANDQASKVVYDAAGDVIVTGSTYLNGVTGPDMVTIKYSGTDGSVLWQKRYTNGSASAMAVDGSGNVVITGSATLMYAAADGALLWEKSGGDGLALDGSGNVVVTGTAYNGTDSDYHTAKYAAADGALVWENRYSGPGNDHDYPTAVAVDGSGNVVVTGDSYRSGSGDDYYTAKYAAADGTLLWEKRYNGPANSADRASAVAVDGRGNVVVTGYSNGTGSYSDYYTAKYAAADGALLWERRSNGGGQAVAVDGNGNVLVAGSSYNSNNNGVDYYTAKYAAVDGAVLWEKRYNGPGAGYGYATAVGVDGSDNMVVTGFCTCSDSRDDYYTAKHAAADGALLWEKRYNGPDQDDQANAVAVDASGNVVVTGYSENGRTSDGGNPDYYTAKYAATDGALLWEKRYNGPANNDDRPNAVAVDVSGNVVVTGASATGYDSWWGEFMYDYYTAKYAAADGALLWETRQNGNGWDSASGVAVDGNGNVVVTGHYAMVKYAAADGALLWANGGGQAVAMDGSDNVVVTGEAGSDYHTSKFAASNGALLWEQRSKGGGQAVAVDGSGNVVVTGFYATAKYAGVDGALLWEKYGANGSAHGSGVAVDGSGNVVVTGSLSGSGSGLDYYTAKYAAADGALLWEQRYNGPVNSDDQANAVAVDGSGNVMVTGSSSGGGSASDFYTAKYAADDGALLWERRYNDPAKSSDRASALAVDGSGNVLVTGYSNNGSGNTNYYTAKYAAADGALLWEKRYYSPADSVFGIAHVPYPTGASLALGPNGMVVVTGSSSGDYATVVYRDTPPPLSFAGWVAGFGLPGGAAAADADPDSDGMTNGVEYILGGNPTVPARSGGPTATASGGDMVFTFSREDGSETPDVTLTVETGTDLMTWPIVFTIGPNTAASSPGVSITENGTAADTITLTIAQGTDSAKFVRLNVTITP